MNICKAITENVSEAFEYDKEVTIKVLDNEDFATLLSGKHVAFITTKNIDYIRNVQEIEILNKYAESVKVVYSPSKKYFGRIISIYVQLLFSSFKAYDYVFVGFAPQLICPIFGWKFRKKLIVDFFISIYDTLVNDRKKVSSSSWIAKLIKYLDKKTLKDVSLIIADTKAHAGYFIEEFGACTNNLGVLYLAANRGIYYPQQVMKRPELQEKYVVFYFGSILPLQGVDVILDCVRLMKDNNNIFFQIVGPIDSAQKVSQSNVEFIPWLAEKELAEYIAASDLCLAGHFCADIEKAKRTIAGKTYIYEAMKKPVILGDNFANRELFTEDEMHRFVEMGNPEALMQTILEFSKSKHLDKQRKIYVYSNISEVRNEGKISLDYNSGIQCRNVSE